MIIRHIDVKTFLNLLIRKCPNHFIHICYGMIAVLFLMAMTSFGQELPHSFARPDRVAIKHLHLDLKVDFGGQEIIGLSGAFA